MGRGGEWEGGYKKGLRPQIHNWKGLKSVRREGAFTPRYEHRLFIYTSSKYFFDG